MFSRPLLLTKDGVHEQYFSSVHIWRELGIVDFRFLCLLITLDEDLANSDGAAAVPETLLHGLACGETQSSQLGSKCYPFEDICRLELVICDYIPFAKSHVF